MKDSVSASPPDFLVVSLCSVRASDFPGGGDGAPRMPFLESLRKECITFPHAASSAPWSLPSHASIFTGLDPWEHGCHGRGRVRLAAQISRLPERLQRLGYRTLCVAGNPLISPAYGLAQGFDRIAWGEWWEGAFPIFGHAPHSLERPDPQLAALDERLRRRLVATAFSGAKRLPVSLSISGGLVHRLKFGAAEYELQPWIEPTLGKWVRETPSNTPLFAFVNFIDAHEPYLEGAGTDRSLFEWYRDMRIPQDSLSLVSGKSTLERGDIDRLRRIYQRTIQHLDERIRRVVEIFQEAGRWDRTVLVLSSDHGQAFGENGVFWHAFRADEAELRVPLWLRRPGDGGGGVGRGWASPTDLTATVLHELGPRYAAESPPNALQVLADRERSRPFLAIGDGTSWNLPLCRYLPPARLAELDRTFGVAYQGSYKVIADPGRTEIRAFDVDADPSEARDLWPGHPPDLDPLAHLALSTARALLSQSSGQAESPLDQRLRSWGYM